VRRYIVESPVKYKFFLFRGVRGYQKTPRKVVSLTQKAAQPLPQVPSISEVLVKIFIEKCEIQNDEHTSNTKKI